MRLHGGGGRIVAHARGGAAGQAIGTGIRHALRPRPTGGGPVRVVEPPFRAPLIARFRLAHRGATAAAAAVDLAVVVVPAEVEDLRATRAANSYENVDDLHAPTFPAARRKLASPVRLLSHSPSQRPRATRRLREASPWAFCFCGRGDHLRDAGACGHFSADASRGRFLRIAAIDNTLGVLGAPLAPYPSAPRPCDPASGRCASRGP